MLRPLSSCFARPWTRWWWSPQAREPVEVHGPKGAPAAGPLKVCVWNVQYAAGHGQLFFYDGGEAVSVSRATVLSTLEGIAEQILRYDADVVLLQEVDRGSRRTHFVDQHAWLAAHLDHPWHASTPYHRSRFVPVPTHEMLGRVEMHLSVFSRVPLLPGTRVALPTLRESRLRRAFNLRRALMAVPVDHERGPVWLLHTHLSAFSRGDGTVPRQLARIGVERARVDATGAPWLLAGDFNALPPGDDPSRLGAAAQMYGSPSPLAPLYGSTLSAVPLAAHQQDPDRYRTWVPFGAIHAERAIDHAFASSSSHFDDVRVAQEALGLSDHLPLLFRWDPFGADDVR